MPRLLTDPSGSSEDNGFETDPMDDFSSPYFTDTMSISSEFVSEDPTTNSKSNLKSPPLNWLEESLTDEQKLNLRPRSLTTNDDKEKTRHSDLTETLTDTIQQICITQVDTHENDSDNDDDDDYYDNDNNNNNHNNNESDKDETFPADDTMQADLLRSRTATVTNNSEMREMLKINYFIPEEDTEDEYDEFVLYVQKNSRMIFAGIIEQSLLTDEYVKSLWGLILEQMAKIEIEIHNVSIETDTTKPSSEIKMQLNENTRLLEFERVFDGTRYYRKIPSDESTYITLLAQEELKRNPDCKVIGLSRGSHLISVDHRLPDRFTYICRRCQDNL